MTGNQRPKALGIDNEGLHDISCTGCKKFKRERDGEYHCKYCGVLCEPCSSKHPKIPKKKSHWAVKIRMLEEERVIRKPTFNYVSKCEIHKTKLVLGYCLNCSDLVCNTCLKEEHKDCEVIENVERIAADIKREKEHQNARAELFDLLQRSKNSTKSKNKELQKLNKQSENIDKALHQTQVKLIDMVLDIITRYKTEKDKFYEKEHKSIQSEIDKCKNLAPVLENAVEKIDSAFHTGKQTDFWIALKKLEKIITDCEVTLDELENEPITEAKFEFHPNTELERFLKNPESIGTLKLTPSKLPRTEEITLDSGEDNTTKIENKLRTTPGASGKRMPSGNKKTYSPNSSIKTTRGAKSVDTVEIDSVEKAGGNTALEFIGMKEIKLDLDKTECCVTGSTFLTNGRLVLVDYNNQRLKLFNPEYELVCHKWFEDRPWDVTDLETEIIAVSFPFIKTIKIMKVCRDFVVQSEVRTEYKCHGVGYHKVDKTLWLACGEGKKTQLQVYGLDGIIKKIIIPKHGILQEPSYVIMGKDNSKFFVSDLKNGIVAFSTVKDCEVLFQYYDENIKKYWGIDCDAGDRVFVVTTDPDCLYMLHGQFNGRLLSELEGDEKPCAVAYNAILGTLVVTWWKSQDIAVYKVVPNNS